MRNNVGVMSYKVTGSVSMYHTLRSVRICLQEVGMTIAPRDGEYRVNFRGGSEDTSYYTNDLSDALDTGRAMSQGQRSLFGGR